jgi:hypothetical protein
MSGRPIEILTPALIPANAAGVLVAAALDAAGRCAQA